ncbi:MAG TPA: SH3 domain-containing protein [Waterburya sp.]|jgi:hypothetical protein
MKIVGFTLSLTSESVSEEFNFMATMNRLGKSVHVLAAMAIATTGMSTSALAGSGSIPSQGGVKLAQRSLAGQCRAAKLSMPIYRAADTTSEAVRLLSANEQVTLADDRVNANGFIRVSSPAEGYVQAVNLTSCSDTGSSSGSTSGSTGGSTSGGTPSASSKDLCRRVVRPPQGLVIRREATTASAQVGSLAYLARVTITTIPATVKQADNRDWVEISAPVRGWVSNGLNSEPKSNLAYCE